MSSAIVIGTNTQHRTPLGNGLLFSPQDCHYIAFRAQRNLAAVERGLS